MTRLSNLRSRLLEFYTSAEMTPQARGKHFEQWLGDLLGTYDLDPNLDIVNAGEQIDFTFWHGDLFVVGEARWRTDPVDTPQVRDFFGKLHERPAFALGLIVSMGGFTEPALGYISRHAGNRTVLTVGRSDLDAVLRGEPEFPTWLGRTLRHRLDHP